MTLFTLNRGRVLCALALALPAATFAEESIVVTAQPQESAHAAVHLGGDTSADGRSGCAGS